MKKNRYVTDTNGLISYYCNVFTNLPNYNKPPKLSNKAKKIYDTAINYEEGSVLLVVPSIVFIEIYIKWYYCEEFTRRLFYDIYSPLSESPNVEIRPIDQETLENLLSIGGCLQNHDLHDKLIVASAITLQCPLITFDNKIIQFSNTRPGDIPFTIN